MKSNNRNSRQGITKQIFFIICLLGILNVSVTLFSACEKSTTDSLPEKGFNSMVELYDTQVIRMQTLTVSSGQYIGNDTIITVIDYEDIYSGKFRLDALRVTGQKADIKLLTSDPQTGTTLFRVPGIEKKKGTIRNTATLKDGENVVIIGWGGPSGISKMIPATIYGNPSDTTLVFSVRISRNDLQTADWVPTSGATVTDMEGNILGLVKQYNDSFDIESQTDITITVVSIDRITELLSPDIAE